MRAGPWRNLPLEGRSKSPSDFGRGALPWLVSPPSRDLLSPPALRIPTSPRGGGRASRPSDVPASPLVGEAGFPRFASANRYWKSGRGVPRPRLAAEFSEAGRAGEPCWSIPSWSRACSHARRGVSPTDGPAIPPRTGEGGPRAGGAWWVGFPGQSSAESACVARAPAERPSLPEPGRVGFGARRVRRAMTLEALSSATAMASPLAGEGGFPRFAIANRHWKSGRGVPRLAPIQAPAP